MIDRDAFFEKVLNDNLYFDSNIKKERINFEKEQQKIRKTLRL